MSIRGGSRQVGRVSRVRRSLPWVGPAVLLMVAAGCGSAPGSTREVSQLAPVTVRATLATSGVPLTVLSVSFVSASEGWLLATPCAGQPTCRTVVMRETVDGGRIWFAVPAPDAPPSDVYQGGPPADSVGTILFTAGGRGWAFGAALWQTTDGGGTWQQVSVPGGQIRGVAAGAGRVLALTERCRPGGSMCSAQVYATVAGADDWRAIPGAGTDVPSAGPTGYGPGLAVSGEEGYLVSTPHFGQGRSVLLGGPVSGTARWTVLPFPCRGEWSAAPAAAPGGWLFIGCAGEGSTGNQFKVAYLSADGGRTWREVTAPPFGGYLAGASMNATGTIFLSGDRMGIYISWNRGRSWQVSRSLESAASMAGAGFPLTGSVLTGTFGYAFQEGANLQPQLWLTRDGGRTWTSATIR